MNHVAYIISMPHGIDRWTFREIDGLIPMGMTFSLFPIRHQPGPVMPRDSWRCFRYRRWSILLEQIPALLGNPRRYVTLLREALETGTVIDLLLAQVFARRMARWGVERIHCVFGDHKLFIGYYCKKLLNLPLSVALYGYDLKANPNWAMFRRAVAACDAIVTNCAYNRHLLRERTDGVVDAPVHVVRHFAEPVPVRGGAFRVLIVGGFSERKGHDVLLRAVQKLGEKAACVEVWAAGYPGPVDVETLARQQGMADRVRVFKAPPDEVIELLYDQCDLFCLPSKTDQDGISEGLPVALIEAMSHGKPVISTRIAGIPELVASILVEPDDVAGLAEALVRYLEDPLLRERDGARNLEIVRRHYSPDNLESMRRLFAEEPLVGGPAEEATR
ncbi:MAG: glycosyltransferase family 4 protein [Anaerolineae bacterium]|nr:glycosyltransferase family 4 protein [Anaerolineae bacterium]